MVAVLIAQPVQPATAASLTLAEATPEIAPAGPLSAR